MADNPSEKKISETSGVKAVLDEAAERIEATWREKLLRETADLRTENALLMAQVDEFSRKLAEVTDRNEKIEADCNERVAFIEEKFELDTASLELENNELHAASVRYLADARISPMLGNSTGRSSNSMPRPWPWSMRSSDCAASVTPR